MNASRPPYKDDRKAEEYLAGWKLDTQARLAALEDAIFESTARQAELTERLRRSEETASTSKAQCESAILEAAAQKERLAGLIDAVSYTHLTLPTILLV